jgi:drug/metabolite transporter (DMT)-like permease
VFFIASNTCGKIVFTQGVLVTDYAVAVNFTSLLFLLPFLKYFNQNPFTDVPKKMRASLASRSFLGAGGMFFYLFSFYYLPLSHIIVIFHLYPIVSSFFAYFLNGEPISKFEIAAFLICLCGVFLFALSKSQEETEP